MHNHSTNSYQLIPQPSQPNTPHPLSQLPHHDASRFITPFLLRTSDCASDPLLEGRCACWHRQGVRRPHHRLAVRDCRRQGVSDRASDNLWSDRQGRHSVAVLLPRHHGVGNRPFPSQQSQCKCQCRDAIRASSRSCELERPRRTLAVWQCAPKRLPHQAPHLPLLRRFWPHREVLPGPRLLLGLRCQAAQHPCGASRQSRHGQVPSLCQVLPPAGGPHTECHTELEGFCTGRAVRRGPAFQAFAPSVTLAACLSSRRSFRFLRVGRELAVRHVENVWACE